MSGNGKRKLAIAGIVVLVVGIWFVWRSNGGEAQTFAVYGAEHVSIGAEPAGNDGSLSYAQLTQSEAFRAFKPAANTAVTVLAADYAGVSPEASIVRRADGARSAEVIDWGNANGWVEWTVDIPRDGLYELIVDYAPLKGGFSQIVRGVQIDGAYPFAEAERIGLDRLWKDGKYPFDKNAIGNEIRPVQAELTEWRAVPTTNYALDSEPLRWALSAGTHTVRLIGKKEPVSLHSITFASPEIIPSYMEYSRQHPQSEDRENNWFEIVEAERYAYKNAVSIQALSVAEPNISPDPKGKIVYNAVGGGRWSKPGEKLAWEITVPKTGRYAIDVKYYQGFNGKANAYRTLLIDGKVPFEEMRSYRFASNKSLSIEPLADEKGNPYLFHLTEGTHLLELAVDTTRINPVIQSLFDLNDRLADTEKKIREITGNYGHGSEQNVDTARTWDMRKYMPDIESQLQAVVDDLLRICDYLDGLNQAVTDPTTALRVNADRVAQLLADVDEIPNRVGVFGTVRTSINTWMEDIESQPIQLDYLVVRNPETSTGLKTPGTWNKFSYAAANFVGSFFQEYDTHVSDGEALEVWVQRGRDYVDLLELMVQQEFTPQTGIRVNVNLVPNANVLLLGNVAGDQPDVALGVPLETPVDFAMRGSAEPLNGYPGAKEVLERFNPGLLRSYWYDDKLYGLPETQTYYMLFYRTDLFEQLKLEPPDTWDDVLDILPTLQENGMSFYLPKSNFYIPFYQYGAEFYKPNGLEPSLTSDEGVNAFKQWTSLFSKYNLPKEANFVHHFRDGDIPIGVADFNLYMQLTVGAPEIDGKWKMLPLPGVLQPDGTVVRWTHNESTTLDSELPSSLLMLNKSERKDDAWKFISWWTSDEVQSRFSTDIESFAGIAYRWNTANQAAMQTMPWSEEDLNALNEQDRWVKNMPYVPGYYYLSREIDFAWNNTVVGHMPAREALEKAELSLLREMMRKQEEFGLSPEDDLNVMPYDTPYERRKP